MEDSICLKKSGFGKSNGFEDSISVIMANKKDQDKPLTMRQSANMLGDLNSSSPPLENFLKTGKPIGNKKDREISPQDQTPSVLDDPNPRDTITGPSPTSTVQNYLQMAGEAMKRQTKRMYNPSFSIKNFNASQI